MDDYRCNCGAPGIHTGALDDEGDWVQDPCPECGDFGFITARGQLEHLCQDFAKVMFDEMNRQRIEGRSGWQGMSSEQLWQSIEEHVKKGDAIDVANLCAFAWHNKATFRYGKEPQ